MHGNVDYVFSADTIPCTATISVEGEDGGGEADLHTCDEQHRQPKPVEKNTATSLTTRPAGNPRSGRYNRQQLLGFGALLLVVGYKMNRRKIVDFEAMTVALFRTG